jgi:radical SAM protein with 4Fe4S-binding SPASM domain
MEEHNSYNPQIHTVTLVTCNSLQVCQALLVAKRANEADVETRLDFDERPFIVIWETTQEKRKGNGWSLPPMLGPSTADGIGRARGINDGKGFVFVSHLGEVFPSGFLPVSAGNIRKQSLTELYRHSPLFVSLRDSRNLKGKCGICEFRKICGGSRARAYALTGDVFAGEPCCTWQPKGSVTGVGAGTRPVEQTRA